MSVTSLLLDAITNWAAATLVLVLLLCAHAALGTPTQVVYANDFEGAVGAEWSVPQALSATPVGGRKFLGEFANTVVTLQLANLPAHTQLSVSFDLFILKSWDGNRTDFGPDTFQLSVRGEPTLIQSTFSTYTAQSYPGVLTDSFPANTGAVEVNTLGYAHPNLGPADAVYRLTATFNHTAPSVTLDFSGLNLQDIGDESWGLDNVRVESWNSAAGVKSFVYENDREFFSGGDLDGDGRLDLVIVDKITGNYRLAYQLSAGNYTWVNSRASGVENVTGFSLGKLLNSSHDALVFTAPEANRLNIFDASSSSSTGLPFSLFLRGIGPNLAIAVDIGGTDNNALDDLFAGSIWNGGTSPNFVDLIRNPGALNLLHKKGSRPMTRGNALTVQTGTRPLAGVFFREASNDLFWAFDLSSGLLVSTLLTNTFPPGSDYVYANFSSSVFAQFLFYTPGQSNLVLQPARTNATADLLFGTTSLFPLPNSIRQVFTLPGVSSTKLLVIFGEGMSAAVYNFDGTNAPTVVQQFTAQAGETFTGAGALGANNFMLYSGRDGSLTSTFFQTYNFNGANYTSGVAGNLPALSGLGQRANVFLFQGEPFVTRPALVRSLNAEDWSSLLMGIPGSLTVTAERFQGTNAGLGTPTSTSLGTTPASANAGLVNQYMNIISLFGYTPANGDAVSDISISPPSGTYPTGIVVRLTASNPTDEIFYRLSGPSGWTRYNPTAPIQLFSNSTVSCYGQPPSSVNSAKSRIKTATYQFTRPPGLLDSDGDGIPDYVELAKGTDPHKADTDGDGYSDFDEALNGFDPATYQTNGPPPLYRGNEFDLAFFPRPLDPLTYTFTNVVEGTPGYVRDLQGGSRGSASARDLVTNGLIGSAVRINGLIIDPNQRFFGLATEPNFAITTAFTDKSIGRELLALLPMPGSSNAAAPAYIYGGGDLQIEANNWLIATSNAVRSAKRPLFARDLTMYDTVVALLLECRIGDVLVSRGDPRGTNLTLFPFRPSDAGRVSLTDREMVALEASSTNGLPAYSLLTMFGTLDGKFRNSADPDTVPLRDLTAAIYRLSALSNNPAPATYVSPVDALRQLISLGTLPASYLSGLGRSYEDLAEQRRSITNLLNQLGPRPIITFSLEVRADTFGGSCTLLDRIGAGTTVSLYHPGGVPYRLLDGFYLVPGSRVDIVGYSDITSDSCPGQAVEVISLSFVSSPIPSPADTNGNMLPDAWEAAFGLSDPNGDADGDGANNLAEMMAGTDPRDPNNHPPGGLVAAENLFSPLVKIEKLPSGNVRLTWSWPAESVDKVRFEILSTPALGIPFADSAIVPKYVGGKFEAIVPVSQTAAQFYQVYYSLK